MLTEQAIQHLAHIGYTPQDPVYLLGLLPKKSNDGRVARFVFPDPSKIPFSEWEGQGRGIHTKVNKGGLKDQEIDQCCAVFYEHDRVDDAGKAKLMSLFPVPVDGFVLCPERSKPDAPVWLVPKDIQQGLWVALGLPEPTIQVDTGNKSIHSYWTLKTPVSVAEWRELQSDLIAYALADDQLRNPSANMRLAGSIHPKTGRTATIISSSGSRYDYAQLRAIVPRSEKPAVVGVMSWNAFDRDFRVPIADAVPLEAVLSRASRDLLAHGVQDGRNTSGAALVRDILGAVDYLNSVGQRFDGDPYDLFLEFCKRCPDGGGWDQREWDSIWKSGIRDQPGSSLSPEQINKCIKAWAWRNQKQQFDLSGVGKSISVTKAMLADIPSDASEEDRLRIAIANYNRVLDSGNQFQILPMRRQLSKEFALSIAEIDQLSRDLLRGGGSLAHIADVNASVYSEAVDRATGQSPVGDVKTGIPALDDLLQGGYQRSDLVIIAGRPSMGKTAMTLTSLLAASRAGLPCLLFSLEMSKDQIARRLIAAESGVPTGSLRSGLMEEKQWIEVQKAIAEVSPLPIYVDDTPGISVAQIALKCRQLSAQVGQIGLVMVDYLSLVDGAIDDGATGMARISRALKAIGREFNVPMVALSQLNRSVESRSDKRPMLSDLRESGAIEQDADVVIMLYRDEYYNSGCDRPDEAELIVRKQRNGPLGTATVLFDKRRVQFRSTGGEHSRSENLHPKIQVYTQQQQQEEEEFEYLDD